jgi:hypothetical protein
LRAGYAGLFIVSQTDEETIMSRFCTLTRRVITFGTLALLAFGLGPAVAKAAPEVFTASGWFQDGFMLSGTMTIDTATGKVSSVDLIVKEGSAQEIVFKGQVQSRLWNSATRINTIGYFSPPTGAGGIELQLTLPVSTLVDYEGGRIEGWPNFASFISLDNGSGGVQLLGGSLKPTGTEPPLD